MIGSWLFKLLVGFAIVGLVLFDAGSLVVNFFTLDSKADEIATVVSTAIVNRELTETDASGIEAKAGILASEADARLVRATVDAEGVVHVRLRRTAETLVIGQVGPIKDWAKATSDARAGTS
jgi:hypothetical protein